MKIQNIKKGIFLILIVCGSLLFAQESLARQKPFVDGVVIKDCVGNPLKLQGFNWYIHSKITEQDVKWMADKGFNYVRINFYWDEFEPTEGAYSSDYIKRLDDFMSWAQKYGMYASINFHQWQLAPQWGGQGLPGWLVSKGGYSGGDSGLVQCASDLWTRNGYGATMRPKFEAVWRWIVTRYKDNPSMIAYEIFNEPMVSTGGGHSATTGAQCMQMYKDMTVFIRGIDPETIIIYHWLNGEEKVNYPNIMWSSSYYYAYGGTSANEITNYFNGRKDRTNVKLGTPYIISEWGAQSPADSWVRNSFIGWHNSGLNNGYEAFAWFTYYLGPNQGWQAPRNSDGSDTWLVASMKDYLQARSVVTCGTTPPTTKKGDLNSDSRVDIIDLGIFLSNWGATSKPASDLNQDGKVDIIDLGILLSNWG